MWYSPFDYADPYPFAIDECFDIYRVLVESAGKIIGMSGVHSKFSVIFSGDSACVHNALIFPGLGLIFFEKLGVHTLQ